MSDLVVERQFWEGEPPFAERGPPGNEGKEGPEGKEGKSGSDNLGWISVVSEGGVPADLITDAKIAAASDEVESPSGKFTNAMDGLEFSFPGAGPILVNPGGLYTWKAHPIIGIFEYISPTKGKLSVPSVTAVEDGEIIIGKDATEAFEKAFARGHAYIPAGVTLISNDEPAIPSKHFVGGGDENTSRIVSTQPMKNVLVSSWAEQICVSTLTIIGNGFGAQPANALPAEGVAPNWENSGCGIIFAHVTKSIAMNVKTFFCGGDIVTPERNGVAGIWLTMGSSECTLIQTQTEFNRSGINEDNYFSEAGKELISAPLYNTYHNCLANYNVFGLGFESGNLSRGAVVSNFVGNYNVHSGLDIHSTKYISAVSPRCNFNGKNFTNSGIAIYGTETIPCEFVSITDPQCYSNGSNGIKFSDFVNHYRVEGGITSKNFRHGVYCNNESNNGYIRTVSRDNGLGTDVPNEYDGVRVTSCQHVIVESDCCDDQAEPTQTYGVRTDGTSDYIVIGDNCLFKGNKKAPVLLTGIHSRVGALTSEMVLNFNEGFAGQVGSRNYCGGNTGVTTKKARWTQVECPMGKKITNLYVEVGKAGKEYTSIFLQLYDKTGKLLAKSADVKASFATPGLKKCPLETPYVPLETDSYIIGILFIGVESPTIRWFTSGIEGYSATAPEGGLPPSGVENTEKTEPANIVPVGSGTAYWFGWS